MSTGKLSRVRNKQRKPAANRGYYHVRIRDGRRGKAFDLLLTGHELDRAIGRAQKNREDIPRDSFLGQCLRFNW